jgi:hypothetical protein
VVLARFVLTTLFFCFCSTVEVKTCKKTIGHSESVLDMFARGANGSSLIISEDVIHMSR